jgi:peptidoglycan hydrolase-like protein with peptidoglycan-binding domain
VAAGRANHAGAGTWKGLVGNSTVFGVERENVGNGSEPWTLVQYDTAAKVHAALIRAHGSRWDLVCEHKEWAPRRKIDAWGVDGNVMRDLVRDRLRAAPTPGPAPAPAPSGNEFLQAVHNAAVNRPVIKLGDRGSWVKDFQEGINQVVGRPVLVADGSFGPSTERWAKQFQKDHGLRADGVVGVQTWEQMIARRLTGR